MCALAAVAYLQRNLGVAESTFRIQLHLSKDQSGILQSWFFWSYAIFQIPMAWLGHRFGPRFGLSAFCLLCSAATLLTGFAHSFEVLCLIRFLMGIGQAAALPCIAEVVSIWFPPALRGRATGWVAAFMQVGALASAFATGPILDATTLQVYFILLALPGFLWGLGFYAWFRNDPTEFTGLTAWERSELPAQQSPVSVSRPAASPWGSLFVSPVLWLVCGQQFCRAAGYIFFGTWFATFLQETRELNVNKSGIATGYTYAGVLVGSLAGGIISDWILRRTGNARWARQGVAGGSMLFSAICIGISYYMKNTNDAILLLTIGAFFTGAGGPPAYAVTMEISGRYVATVFAVMNMAGNIGAAIFPSLIPKLLGPQRTQWDAVFLVFVLLYLTAAVLWIFIDPRKRIFNQDQEATRL